MFQNVNVSEVRAKKLTVFMARVELIVRFPGQWLLLYVAAEEGNARVPDLGFGGVWSRRAIPSKCS